MEVTEEKRLRLGILVSHPIQYYSPWFRALSKRLDVEVFYCHKQDSTGQATAGFGVPFEWDTPLFDGYRYRWLKNVSAKPSIAGFFGCDNPELFEIATAGKFDAFLIFGWNRKSYWQAMRACWKSQIPILMRGDSQLAGSSTVKNLIKKNPYHAFLSRINAHMYPGVRNREYLEYFGVRKSQLFWCPHFVENERFAQGAELARSSNATKEFRASLHIPVDAFVALYVGKLIEGKKPADFIKGMVGLIDSNPSIHAIIVGSGPLETNCKSLASQYPRNLHFIGFKNQTELPAIYASCDCLVLPGIETWGLVVNEAMACGLPCVVSSCCGCAPDMIDDNETGFVFPVGNVEALSHAVLQLKRCVDKDRGHFSDFVHQKSVRYSIDTASNCLINTMNVLAQQ